MNTIKLFIIAIFISHSFVANAQLTYTKLNLQNYNVNYKPNKNNDSIKPIEAKNKSINVGLCFGFNYLCKNLYDAFISPDSNFLRFEKIPSNAFIFSTILTIPIFPDNTSEVMLVKDNQGNVVNAYQYSNGLTAIIAVNLLQLNKGQNSEALNYRLDGGIGFGWRFKTNFLFSLTYDLTAIQQPREYLKAYKDKQIFVDGDPITTINKDDPAYFSSKYVSSVSLRFAYAFVNKEF